jgi:hypothetical protein
LAEYYGFTADKLDFIVNYTSSTAWAPTATTGSKRTSSTRYRLRRFEL